MLRSRRCCVPSSPRGVRNASCGSRGSGFGDDRAMRCAGDVPGGFGGVDDACAAVFSASFWKGDDAALLRLLGVAGDGLGIYVCEACIVRTWRAENDHLDSSNVQGGCRPSASVH